MNVKDNIWVQYYQGLMDIELKTVPSNEFDNQSRINRYLEAKAKKDAIIATLKEKVIEKEPNEGVKLWTKR